MPSGTSDAQPIPASAVSAHTGLLRLDNGRDGAEILAALISFSTSAYVGFTSGAGTTDPRTDCGAIAAPTALRAVAGPAIMTLAT